MYKYIKEQENFLSNELKKENADYNWLLEYFKAQIEFISHERFIHLIVTLFFSLLFIISIIISFLYTNILLILLDLILLVLVLFYIIHYYRLENGLQSWYKMYNEISKQKRDAL